MTASGKFPNTEATSRSDGQENEQGSGGDARDMSMTDSSDETLNRFADDCSFAPEQGGFL
jgi:hypothetical protein